jgi:hypothetical protein
MEHYRTRFGIEDDYYSFEVSNVLVMSLNANLLEEGLYWWDRRKGVNMIDELEKDLRATKMTWKFILLHYPFYCSYYLRSIDVFKNHCSEIDTEFLGRLDALCNKYKVNLVLSAHIHLYSRMQRSEKDLFKTWHLSCGAAGKKGGISSFDERNSELFNNGPEVNNGSFKHDKMVVNRTGFCKIEVIGERQVNVKFIGKDNPSEKSRGTEEYERKDYFRGDIDGKYFDQFTFDILGDKVE